MFLAAFILLQGYVNRSIFKNVKPFKWDVFRHYQSKET